jgi:hypothetical protein
MAVLYLLLAGSDEDRPAEAPADPVLEGAR